MKLFWIRETAVNVCALVIGVAIAAAGCAAIAPLVDRSSDKAADAVAAYCNNLTAEQRQAFGDQVRAKAAPHSIVVTCS